MYYDDGLGTFFSFVRLTDFWPFYWYTFTIISIEPGSIGALYHRFENIGFLGLITMLAQFLTFDAEMIEDLAIG